MADPATLTLALKVIDFAFDANKAIWGSGLGENDFKAVKSLIDAGKAVRGAAAGSPERTLGQAHEDMTLAAFTMAWQTHWGGSQELVWRQVRKSTKEVAACLATARGRFPPEVDAAGKPDMEHHALLRGCPTRSPAYELLWQLFSDPEEGLLHEPAKSRAEFVRHFRTAWAGLLPSPLGEPLRRPRRDEHFNEAVREILAWDFVDWRTRHVFGNTRDHEALPAMPLERIYVEPVCEPEGKGPPTPIQTKLDGWLVSPPALALVTADFGHGKSLSARMFAARLAEKYLEGDEASPAERWWPVFVRCAGEFRESIATMVALAQREQLQRAGAEKLEAEHPAVGLPSADDQKVVLILDGLDEVHLNPTQTRDLLTRLRDFTSTRRRVVVFTRPGAVERQERETKDRHFALRRFDERQIEAWLVRWRDLVATDAEQAARTRTLSLDAIKGRGLMELAPTPVLLFMIAWTWETKVRAKVEKSGLYERFFLQLARSKCEFDRDAPQGQQMVLKAAGKLLEILVERGHLPPQGKREQAMLWLLGRVAWEHARAAHQGKALRRFDVDFILRRELEIDPGETFQLIQRGLMLVLQVDPFGDDPALEFGHRSFREFLVAHYWRARLIVEPFGPEEEKALLGARLLENESRSLEFLLGLLRREPDAVRRRVVELAERLFFDERLGTHKGPCFEPSKDERRFLREAVLALRCELQAASFVIDGTSLRSLIAGFTLCGESVRLEAPRITVQGALWALQATRATLSRAQLQGVDLRGADFSAANLSGANLTGANLDGANLTGAELSFVDLSRASLVRTNLMKVQVVRANLSHANLLGANLEGTYFREVTANGINLKEARLRRAVIRDSDFSDANLTGADLMDSNWSSISLERAWLDRAVLTSTKFVGVDVNQARRVDPTPGELGHGKGLEGCRNYQHMIRTQPTRRPTRRTTDEDA